MLLAVDQFKSFIKSKALFEPQDKILLAVSGGKDSVCMVHLFSASGFKFDICHCNFNLRGEEAKRDENFVRDLANHLQVDFHFQSFDTESYAAKHKISIQMAARDLRYSYFEEIKEKFGYQKVAIAHHQNDMMETMLINLIRGTGIAGLRGIKSKKGDIIRPMLCFNAAAIEEMVTESRIEFVEDSSNSSNKYMRNKIRLDIIPEMKKINPSLEDTFQKNRDYFNELEELLIQNVKNSFKELFIQIGNNSFKLEIAKIDSLKPQKLILYELLRTYGFNITQVQNIISSFNSISGKSFESDSHQIVIDREFLYLSKRDIKLLEYKYIHRTDNAIKFGKYQLHTNSCDIIPINLKSESTKIFVDAETLIFPLKLRTWQKSDRFFPYGMKGEKKLSDFFISQKISINHKKNIPILINGDGKIIWICGYRSDDRFKVKSNTKKLFIFELNN